MSDVQGADAGGYILRSREGKFAFYLTLIYLALEYGRPQSLIAPLQAVRIPAMVSVLLALALALSGKASLAERQTRCFLGILALMVVLGPIAVNNYWALMIFKAMALNFVVYLAVVTFVDSREKFRFMLGAWVAIHVFLGIMGYVKGGKGIGGFLADENDFCMTLNMAIPVVFFLAFAASSLPRKFLYFAVVLFLLSVVVMTMSRGGLVGLVAALVYLWARSRRKALFAVLLVLMTGFVLAIASATYWDRLRTIETEGTTEGTGAERIYTWKVGWFMFLHNPFIGVGQGNFPFVFRDYEVAAGFEEGFRGRSRAGRAAHSVYITLLAELGLAGAVLFGLMTARNLKLLKSLRNPGAEVDEEPRQREVRFLALGLEGSLVAFLASGVFISTLYYPNFWILTGFIVALRNMAGRTEASPDEGKA
jgi:O-antigen ligase